MATVFIPPQMRDATGGLTQAVVEASTLRQAFAAVEARFPQLSPRLRDGDSLAPGLAVSIDGEITSLGLLASLRPDSEIHILPAVGGG